MKPSAASDGELKRAAAELVELQAIRSVKPSTADVKQAFRHRLTETPDGKFTVDLKTRAEILAFREMAQPSRRRLRDRMHRISAETPTVKMTTPQGEVREIREAVAESAARNGMRPVVAIKISRWTSFERGEDGLLYRENLSGGWDCLGRCAISRPYFPCTHPACEWCGEAAP